MNNLNPCRCGNRPERVTTSTGLVRISCVLSRCPDLVCLRPGVAERAWNEANPSDDAPTLRQNAVPAVHDAYPGVNTEISLPSMAREGTWEDAQGKACWWCKVGTWDFGKCVLCNHRIGDPLLEE